MRGGGGAEKGIGEGSGGGGGVLTVIHTVSGPLNTSSRSATMSPADDGYGSDDGDENDDTAYRCGNGDVDNRPGLVFLLSCRVPASTVPRPPRTLFM